MSLKYLNSSAIGAALTCAWQHDLGTGEDPANGHWYTNGANGDGIGLYGGLTDSIPSQIQLLTNDAVYQPQTILAATGTVDNTNGLNSSANVTLSYSYSDSQSSTHSMTESVSTGAEFSVSVNEGVATAGAKFNINFTFSSTQATTTTIGETNSFSQTVPITVPPGKVYQAVLTAVTQKITIPYTVTINVNGPTETWFEDRVNGHYNYSVDAGTAFAWINQYGCAGGDSIAYSGANGVGTVTINGSVTASQTVNFSATVVDITGQTGAAAKMIRSGADVSAILPPGKKITTITF